MILKNEEVFMASEKLWMRETEKRPCMDKGEGAFSEVWRSCLCGVKYETLKPCLLGKVD